MSAMTQRMKPAAHARAARSADHRRVSNRTQREDLRQHAHRGQAVEAVDDVDGIGCSSPKDVTRDSLLNNHFSEACVAPVFDPCQIHDGLLAGSHARHRLDHRNHARANELGSICGEHQHRNVQANEILLVMHVLVCRDQHIEACVRGAQKSPAFFIDAQPASCTVMTAQSA